MSGLPGFKQTSPFKLLGITCGQNLDCYCQGQTIIFLAIFSNFFPLSVSGSATWRSSWERAIGRRQNFKTEPVVPGKNWSNLKKPLKRNPGEMTGEAVHVEDLHIVVVFLSVSRGASSKMLLDTTQEHWPMIQKMPKPCQTEQPVITNWSSWTPVLR